jgi:PAS domain S-box-containing protein
MAVLFLCLWAFPGGAADKPQMIILNSYHHGFEWSDAEVAGLLERLRKDDQEIDPRIEYLDAKRHPDAESLARLKDFLAAKYRDKNIDLVICLDNPALEMLMARQSALFADVPVVFAGIGGFDQAMLNGRRQVTGVVELKDFKGTLEIALSFHPGTKHVLVVNDETSSGVVSRRDVEALAPAFAGRVNFRFLPPSTFEEASAELGSLPADFIALIDAFTTDRSGQSVSIAESTRILTSAARVPVYSVHETRLGHGIVGGRLLGGREHGRRTAEIVLKILAGQDPDKIPVDMNSTARPMFDYAQLERLRIPLEFLPPDSFIHDKPVSFIEGHERLVLGTLAVVATLSAMVILLALSMVRRRRVEEELRESEYFLSKSQGVARLGSYYFDTRSGWWISSKTLDEVLGIDQDHPKNVEGWIEVVHPEQKEEMLRYLRGHVLSERKAFEKEYRIIRHNDGQERWVYGIGELEFDETGRPVKMIGTIQDITERKRAEEALKKSERLLDEAQRLTHLGSWEMDLKTREITCSDEIFRLFGARPRELHPTHEDFLARVHPADLEAVLEHYRETLETRKFRSYDYRIVKPDGAVRWVHATGAVDCDGAGAPVGLVGALHDITERKQAEEALRENEERLRLALVGANQGLYDWNLQTDETLVSPEYAAILGYDPAAFRETKARWLDALNPDDRERAAKTFRAYIRGEIPQYAVEFRQRTVSGEWKWILSQGKIVARDEEGKPLRMLGTIMDIGERKLAEEKIRELNEELEDRVRERTAQLEDANRELEAFAYSVSHDLRAPLRAIDGFTRIILDEYGGLLDDEGNRICSIVLREARRMGRLIDDLLAFSRFSRAEMWTSPIDMETLADSAFHEVTTPEERERIEFRVDPLPRSVGDPSLIRQVWTNLLSNAVKFSSKRERAVIEVGSRPEEGENVYWVRDNGAGFDMEYAQELFGVFRRLHHEREFQGTGVGLAIVQRVIRRHGGRVWAEAEVDRGATFYFSLSRNGE